MNYSICVSGAAAGKTVDTDKELAERIGTAIAKSGHIITTGATIGLPYYAARSAKMEGGVSIGFSPAASLREHVHKYRLPIGIFDFVNYTGLNYVGRDAYLVLSSDAVITIGGRMGSLHEFISALEAHKPVGILLGSQGAADLIPQLMEILEPPAHSLVIYDDNPEKLVVKMVALLDKEYQDIQKALNAAEENWFGRTDAPVHRAG